MLVDPSPITGNGLCNFLVLRKSNAISPINSAIQLKHYPIRQLLLLLFVKITAQTLLLQRTASNIVLSLSESLNLIRG